MKKSIALLGLLVLTACPQQADKATPVDPQVEAWGKKAPAQGAAQAANPAAAAKPAGLSGTVLETMDVPEYTYLKLKTAQGEVWAAVGSAKVEKGQEVTVVNPALMQNFKSETLNRTFEQIYFGNLAKEGAGAANPHAGMGMGMGGNMGAAPQGDVAGPHPGGLTPAADLGEIKVAKAEGDNAFTVAEVHQKGADLANKPVVVRAKVVKFNANIMGKNWVHLRDGSGDAKDRSNDLAVTTAAQVKVGDEVLLKGVLHKDRDFGSGYKYPLIVEDGELSPVQ